MPNSRPPSLYGHVTLSDLPPIFWALTSVMTGFFFCQPKNPMIPLKFSVLTPLPRGNDLSLISYNVYVNVYCIPKGDITASGSTRIFIFHGNIHATRVETQDNSWVPYFKYLPWDYLGRNSLLAAGSLSRPGLDECL